jgi:dGTPase
MHTLLVSQIARTIAKALRLSEDLTEAIALGHDLGHTPFGHAGEFALNKIMEGDGGFEHAEQSERVVSVLEGGKGLNLSWEVLDGIVNHQTRSTPATIEGKIVRISDKIAYVNHDIDDAIRAGLITDVDLPARSVSLLGDTSSKRIDSLIHDIIVNSDGKPDILMSDEIKDALYDIRGFLFDRVYKSPPALKQEQKAFILLRYLFDIYTEHGCVYGKGRRDICDYIAGMTDRYAITQFEEYAIPTAWDVN